MRAADAKGTQSLPPDTLIAGVQRLGWMALVYVIGTLTGPVTRLVLAAAFGTGHSLSVGLAEWFELTAVALALAVFALARQRSLPPKHLLDLGLVLQVVGALAMAVREFSHGLPDIERHSFLVPGECVWIMAYALLVPNTPRKTLIASLLAASMGPLVLTTPALMIGRSTGPPLDVALYFLTSTYLCAMLAYGLSRMVHRLHLELKDARQIGSYQLIERIGAGGMGEVWRAQHRLLARPAAIKLIRSSTLGESHTSREALVSRFEREARETATLGSTHTIGIYDFGVTEEGDFYYVMELLEGLSLEHLVQQFGPVEPRRTVYLLLQVCHSLAEAHKRGLIHRDVKPANIMVCRLGPDDDFVKVLDFGLVKQTAKEQTATALSMEGTVMGTPSFMAPEIARARADVDGRADIYSLGCVAYYMLTGSPVFSGDTPLATVLAHVQETPVPLGLRSEFTIPPALEELVMQCLAKDPSDRPPSVAAVRARLATSIPAHAWTHDAAHLWWERHQPLNRVGLSAKSKKEVGLAWPTSAHGKQSVEFIAR